MIKNSHKISRNWHALQVPLSLLFFFIGITFGFTDSFVVSIIFVSVAASILFLNYGISGISHIRKSFEYHTLSVKQSKNSVFGILIARLMNKSFFKKLDSDIRNTILSGSIRAGHLQNPVEISRKTILAFVLSIPIFATVAFVGIILFDQIIFASLIAMPLLVLLYPRFSNLLLFADSSSGYDQDIAYFLSYLHIAHIGKMNLYDSMINLIDRTIFPAIERDAKMLQRWVEFDGTSESFAINRLANEHANNTFKTFLFAYFDISQSNPPGLNDFIKKTASIEFKNTIASDEKSIGKISTIFVFGGIALIMVPALLIMMSFAVPEANIIEMVSITILVTPLLFTVVALFMYHKQSDFEMSFRKSSLLGLCVIVPCYVVTSDILTSVSLGLAITCVINGMHVSHQISFIRSKVDGFVPFLRDLIERRKVDSNFVVSLKKIFLYDMEKKYGMFSEILHDIQYNMNIFSDKKHNVFFNPQINSERLRMMMFVLQSIFDSGHRSSVSGLEGLHSFSEKTIAIKNRMDDTLRMSSILLLFSPLIFFITLSAISTLMLSFTEHVPAIPAGMNLDASTTKYFQKFDVSSILSAMKPAIFVMSLCSGIIISRVAYSSFLATLPMGICMSIAFVIFVGWDFFFDTISVIIQG